MFRWLRNLIQALIRRGSAKQEEDSAYDGPFSYGAEFHAATVGLYDGMKSWRARPSGLPDYEDAHKEPHYYKGSYIVGTLLQLALVAIAALVTGVL